MPAWEASVCSSSWLRASKGTTSRSVSSACVSRRLGSRFLLISWITPITSPVWDTMGTAIMERVR